MSHFIDAEIRILLVAWNLQEIQSRLNREKMVHFIEKVTVKINERNV